MIKSRNDEQIQELLKDSLLFKDTDFQRYCLKEFKLRNDLFYYNKEFLFYNDQFILNIDFYQLIELEDHVLYYNHYESGLNNFSLFEKEFEIKNFISNNDNPRTVMSFLKKITNLKPRYGSNVTTYFSRYNHEELEEIICQYPSLKYKYLKLVGKT